MSLYSMHRCKLNSVETLNNKKKTKTNCAAMSVRLSAKSGWGNLTHSSWKNCHIATCTAVVYRAALWLVSSGNQSQWFGKFIRRSEHSFFSAGPCLYELTIVSRVPLSGNPCEIHSIKVGLFMFFFFFWSCLFEISDCVLLKYHEIFVFLFSPSLFPHPHLALLERND